VHYLLHENEKCNSESGLSYVPEDFREGVAEENII